MPCMRSITLVAVEIDEEKQSFDQAIVERYSDVFGGIKNLYKGQ